MKTTLLAFFSLLCSLLSAQSFQLTDTTFKEGDVLITHAIIFDYDKATFRPESMPFLDSLVRFLSSRQDLEVEISNHTDERWSDKYSLCLSCKRAQAIFEYLVENGIDPKRLVPKGYNDHQPLIVGAKTEEEHSMNRRSEIRILKITN